jgi:hypothetical protein
MSENGRIRTHDLIVFQKGKFSARAMNSGVRSPGGQTLDSLPAIDICATNYVDGLMKSTFDPLNHDAGRNCV